ncbi:unannotated protein [freshwater metagenome]|uniref:Unannotated protein n=1 Tax=freshwater metagenome TaxID=449393 RepID=A0A6J7ILE6_9ZZZZ
MVGLGLREKPHVAEVDTENRDVGRLCELGCAQERSVTAENQNHLAPGGRIGTELDDVEPHVRHEHMVVFLGVRCLDLGRFHFVDENPQADACFVEHFAHSARRLGDVGPAGVCDEKNLPNGLLCRCCMGRSHCGPSSIA